MSGTGKGRGRGWLKLDKNTNNRPGGLPSNVQQNTDTQKDICQPQTANNYCTEQLAQDLNSTTLGTQFSKLVSFIEQIDSGDDGIKFNQKLKAITLFWQQDCQSEYEVRESFNYLFQKCTQDASLGTKLTTLLAARSVAKLTIHDVLMRKIFIDSLQNILDGGNQQLFTSNPVVFRNTLRMLGDFYHKSKLVQHGVTVLSKYIVHYLKLVLQSNDPLDLELLASQLYLNGAAISQNYNEDLQELLQQIRSMLAVNQNLSTLCRFWLLLALDIVSCKYSLLPSDLHRFYQQHLGEKAMANFQFARDALTVQVGHGNKAFDNYQSNVSVLQVTPPESRSPINEQQNIQQYALPSDANQHFGMKQQQKYKQQNFNTEVGEWNGANDFKPMNNQEKAGRPILGAGARLQRIRTNKETSNFGSSDQNWENTDWENCQKANSVGWGNGTKGYGSSKNNKGWEHDDRCEKDY